MDNASLRPILVTGAHRSGTTWVGKTLAASPSVAYIEEPFSVGHRVLRVGICNARFPHWFTYVTDENEHHFLKDIQATLEFRYRLIPQLSKLIQHRRGLRTLLRDSTAFLLNRYFYHPRPLLKDPIAIFSSEWLARRFNMDVVILIRHPAAFVSSIKRMNWPHDFRNFLDQPLLMRDYLSPLADEIRRHIQNPTDIIDDAILLWKMFYFFVHKLQDKHPQYIFLKHEDLSRNPVKEFERLFMRLNIEWTDKIEKQIRKSTSSANPSEAPSGVLHQLRRNSAGNLKIWQQRLSSAEIARIRRGVADVSPLFYGDTDWE